MAAMSVMYTPSRFHTASARAEPLAANEDC